MTVHKMAAEPFCHVRVICNGCRECRDVDLQALAAKVGPEYSLIDRRCRCRITPGCVGWNRFMYLFGVYRHLWSYERDEIWMARDKREREGQEAAAQSGSSTCDIGMSISGGRVSE